MKFVIIITSNYGHCCLIRRLEREIETMKVLQGQQREVLEERIDEWKLRFENREPRQEDLKTIRQLADALKKKDRDLRVCGIIE